MGPMKEPKPLQPLIPLDRLKKVVRDLLGVSKADIDKAEADRLKRPGPKRGD